MLGCECKLTAFLGLGVDINTCLNCHTVSINMFGAFSSMWLERTVTCPAATQPLSVLGSLVCATDFASYFTSCFSSSFFSLTLFSSSSSSSASPSLPVSIGPALGHQEGFLRSFRTLWQRQDMRTLVKHNLTFQGKCHFKALSSDFRFSLHVSLGPSGGLFCQIGSVSFWPPALAHDLQRRIPLPLFWSLKEQARSQVRKSVLDAQH